MTLQPRIHTVSLGHRTTRVGVRWHDIDDCSSGFPPVVREEWLVFAGRLHHGDIVAQVVAKTPELSGIDPEVLR